MSVMDTSTSLTASLLNEWNSDDTKKTGEEANGSFDLDAMTRASSSDGRDSPIVVTPPASVLSLPGVVMNNDSVAPSPVEDTKSEGNTCISVSTTFFPGANIDSIPVDLIIVSSDSVFFYVHSQRLLSASSNGFNGHLPAQSDTEEASDAVISLPLHSAVINILLHTVYGMTCAHYMPTLEDLSNSIAAFKTYGLDPKTYFANGTSLTVLLLNYAPTHAIEVYTIVAQHDLRDLAISVSPHLLSFQLPTLSDELAERMGPLYLKRLFFLHLGRNDAFKRIIAQLPEPHPPTPTCDFTEQKAITRAWSLASAYLTWDARPDMSPSTIERVLLPLTEHLSCELCKKILTDRIKEVVVAWTMVKRTI